MHPDMLTTKKLPAMTMSQLVYGKPAAKRFRLPSRLIFIAALALASVGCATGHRLAAPETETVGQLAAGPSVWHAPTHSSTDLTPSFGAVEGDDDAGSTVSTVTRTDGGNSPESPDSSAELPEVAPKSDGVSMGGVR